MASPQASSSEAADLNRNLDSTAEPSTIPSKEAKWQRFAEWLHCVCVVTFDLELGQAMEVVYPPHIRLAESERTNICYLAFPDSNSGCMGDTQFHVRLRVAPATPTTLLSPAHRRFNASCPPTHSADSGHYWGFVYFRQVKDTSLPRGYFQKSLVILSRLPFVHLFRQLVGVLAPIYFNNAEHSSAVLEAACNHICQWPKLTAGSQLTLHLLGTVFQTQIPCINSQASQLLSAVADEDNSNGKSSIDESIAVIPPMVQPQLLASVQDVDLFQSLGCILSHVHMLWELVLTAEPIVVMATSPTDCSAMVQALTSIISPLNYSAESRPYFTIHDSEFKEFTQRPHGPPPVIIGVTNPFFAKTLQQWPHTIRLGGDPASSPATNHTNFSSSSTSPNNPAAQSIASTQPSQRLRKATARTGSSSGRLLDLPPGLYTAYKPHLTKDTGGHLKKITAGIRHQRPSAVQSALLRRHLLELTHSFMIPLERYIASLMPLQRDISPFRSAPPPRIFRSDDFLATLDAAGPQLTSSLRGDWPGLYKRFLRSPNFSNWYERRHQELTQTLRAVQLQALSQANLTDWMTGRHEVEIVDMVLKLREKLIVCGPSESIGDTTVVSTPLRADIRDRLARQLEEMRERLPDDVRHLFGADGRTVAETASGKANHDNSEETPAAANKLVTADNVTSHPNTHT